ncbi:MAG: Lrp/AsnC family transcriptional regulator [Candidatus Lokiarchaeota archaeon]|nr:Lrp/AsnC family transcriptional regulator [Candidatus Lokiarchaeota archaeon]
MRTVDPVDLKILEELKKDGRKSFNEISDIIEKTEATVRRRVSKMQEEGTIKRFTIEYELDTKPKTSATIKVEPDFKEIKRILFELKKIDEITAIWRLSGECGIFMKVDIESIEQFNPLIEDKISQIAGIKIVETCFITDIIK